MSTQTGSAPTATHLGAGAHQLVVFGLGPDEYGIPIGMVQEIIRHTPARPMPGADHGVEGVINLRNSVITVVDLRAFLPATGEPPAQASVVIVQMPGGVLGLRVDDVREVLTVDGSVIEEPPGGPGERRDGSISGIAKLDDRLLVVIDPVGLLEGRVGF